MNQASELTLEQELSLRSFADLVDLFRQAQVWLRLALF
jgi:hypothetical protein